MQPLGRQRHLTQYAGRSSNEANLVRPLFARIAESSKFQNAALMVIALNAVWIGIDVDWNEPESPVSPVVFEIADHIFASIFSLEVIIRILAYEKKVEFFRKLWNIFDFLLVLLMDIETWVFPLVGLSVAAIRSVSAIRALRLLRLLRITRVFRTFPELGMMVKSLTAATRSVTSTFVLIVCFMYMFACVVTQWWRDKALDESHAEFQFFETHFGSIILSMMTTFQILLIDDAFETIRLTKKENALMGWLLLIYMLIAVFTTLNLMLGVICEIVSSTTAVESRKILQIRVREIIRLALDDTGSDELISAQVYNDQVKPKLKKLKRLNADIVENIFPLLDADNSGFLARDRLAEMLVTMNGAISAEDLQNVLLQIARAENSMSKAFDQIFMLQLGNNLRVALDRMFDDPQKRQRFYTFFPPEKTSRPSDDSSLTFM